MLTIVNVLDFWLDKFLLNAYKLQHSNLIQSIVLELSLPNQILCCLKGLDLNVVSRVISCNGNIINMLKLLFLKSKIIFKCKFI
jgi:hypothetical protein